MVRTGDKIELTSGIERENMMILSMGEERGSKDENGTREERHYKHYKMKRG